MSKRSSDDGERNASPGDAPAERRPRSVVSLLGQKAEPGETPPAGGPSDRSDGEAGGERPERERASGADPLRSSHSTFHSLEPPRHDFDPEKARTVCAEVVRDVLRDFAPALVLLPAAYRLRAQAFIAYARTLLDFARDRSLEGERLAQINRIEFELEATLNGEPPGQPVFVQLAALERERPWPREAFDQVAKVARSRVTVGFPRNQRTAEDQRLRLARATLHAVLGEPPPAAVEAAGAVALRAASLLGWHDSLWHDRPDLGLRMDDAQSPRSSQPSSASFAEVVAAEARAIAAGLEGTGAAIAELPSRLRPAARYALLAAAALTQRAAAMPQVTTSPRLPFARRLALIGRARLGV